ncbi:GDP-mannose:glycolipid 4-beta-D-mannosyltransferase precursor [Microbacterium azadirachtae]|uniref:GDP-mannose:glycolipid 4-beta-D-mannosyltransferase n=1 Tax=Microbacterium azadirachtae TaxID=582680 RepID=A0A0F0KUV5_9MICO|nr:GDP-mannose:glycolipid 4-beta-D-mannosyltransferase precursor [Microbacterium azadirachtae]
MTSTRRHIGFKAPEDSFIADRRHTVTVPLLNHEFGGNPEIRAWCKGLLSDPDYLVRPMRRLAEITYAPSILYVHMPEWLIRRHGSIERVTRGAIGVLAAIRLAKWRGTKVVWHLNNLMPHETDRHGMTDRFVESFSKEVDLAVASTQSALDEFIEMYPMLRRTNTAVIQMGHYRDLISYRPPEKSMVRARLGIPSDARVVSSLGMMRAYKSQEALLDAFSRIPDRDAVLVLAGESRDGDLVARLARRAELDRRVVLRPEFLREETLVDWVVASDLTVLAAARSAKSGSATLSLSFGTPVLVPRRGEFLEWADELGTDWVRTYEGSIRPKVLAEGLALGAPPTPSGIDRFFDWARAHELLAEAFREILPR